MEMQLKFKELPKELLLYLKAKVKAQDMCLKIVEEFKVKK
jgi:hypothetical protein